MSTGWKEIIEMSDAYNASDILLAQGAIYFKRGSESRISG